jgi:hypothetical protein
MRTSSGSVCSNCENNSVHEKARWSITVLASRAAVATSSSSFGLICARSCAASPLSRAASVSARKASAPSDRSKALSRAYWTTLNNVIATTTAVTSASVAWTARTL